MTLTDELAAIAERTKGFLPEDEAAALRDAAGLALPELWLEVGTYCGKSTVHLGSVARSRGAQLVTVDHHRGSEENQPGWEWHDASLVDPHTGRLETLPSLRHALFDAGLDDVVTVLVAKTAQVARWWSSPVTFLFLDGNHTEEMAQHDYAAFAPHVALGGILAVHDVFPDPADGGQAPWHVVERALKYGAFEALSQHGSLRVLRRTAHEVR
jgi:predicted O-methyltransferase YrrM